MECFRTIDFDNNSRLITLSVIIISGLHCIKYQTGILAMLDGYFATYCRSQWANVRNRPTNMKRMTYESTATDY
jgi:hypothetical protein